jgi:glutamyl-tRNA synthetase
MYDAELLDAFVRTLPFLGNGKLIADRLDETRQAQLLAAMSGLKERAKTLVELADGAAFLFAERPLPVEEKAKALLVGNQDVLKGTLDALKAVEGEWNAASAEAKIRTFADEGSLKLGAVAQPLRAALTGKTTSPGVFDVLAVLGREESLARIADQID